MELTGIKLTETAQVVISLIGFLLVWYQIKQLKLAVHGDTHSKLYDHYLKVCELMLEKPYLRPYFYRTKQQLQNASTEAVAERRLEIETMCEIMAGLLEHAALQKDNLPDDSWRSCWKQFMVARFQESPELTRFFQENDGWYAEAFREMLESARVIPRKQAGALAG